jgi:flagellin
MAISILNNIPALAAENQLSMTQANLQQTLEQLSSGSRINSGADDAAGLAIADGLQANVTALTQSSLNANEGVGKLQVADGALSQVTSLLNRAVTLATESANGTVSDGSQRQALDAEFQSIKAEIDNIGSNTTYNGTAIFAGGSTNYNQVDANLGTAAGLQTATSGTLTIETAGSTPTPIYTTKAADTTVGDVINDINNSGTGLVAALDSNGHLMITDAQNRGTSAATALEADTVTGSFYVGANHQFQYNQITSATTTATLASSIAGTLTITPHSGAAYTTSANDTTMAELINDINTNTTNPGLKAALDGGALVITDTGLGSTSANPIAETLTGFKIDGTAPVFAAADTQPMGNTTNSSTMNVFLSDSTVPGSSTIGVTLGELSSGNMNGTSLANDDLQTAGGAKTALADINNAIAQVAALRGSIGAGVNRLQAAGNVISNQTQNLSSAEDGIQAADITQTVANLTKYQILSQTGISALAQANQMQQSVLKLLQ